jgi:hypothetical protein
MDMVGDRFDTRAGKIIADTELDEMRGSVLANLNDDIAAALRDENLAGYRRGCHEVLFSLLDADGMPERLNKQISKMLSEIEDA